MTACARARAAAARVHPARWPALCQWRHAHRPCAEPYPEGHGRAHAELLGKDAPYVPGWDCHGLPIEWKVEEQYRKKEAQQGRGPAVEFRAECRAYAQGWVDTAARAAEAAGHQRRLGQSLPDDGFRGRGDDRRRAAEVRRDGQLYRGAKPVMWSPVEKTALAEAEVEYEDSPAIRSRRRSRCRRFETEIAAIRHGPTVYSDAGTRLRMQAC